MDTIGPGSVGKIEGTTANVIKLLDKAAITEKSEDALRFSQAALNEIHTFRLLKEFNDSIGKSNNELKASGS